MFRSSMGTGAISSFGIALAIAVASLATDAWAETAPPRPPPPPTSRRNRPAQVSPAEWVKVCAPNNAKLCQISEDYALNGGDQVIGSISVQTSPDANKFSLGIQVPIGFLLPAGIPISVDGTKKTTAPFITCLPSPQGPSFFCLAQAEVDGGFVDMLKKGKNLQLSLTSMNKTNTTLDFPLATFTSALEGPDQAALARQRDDAAKALAEKAKERAKQLEGQQGK